VVPSVEATLKTKECLLVNLEEQDVVSASGKADSRGNSGIEIGNKKRFTPGGLKKNDLQVKAACRPAASVRA